MMFQITDSGVDMQSGFSKDDWTKLTIPETTCMSHTHL